MTAESVRRRSLRTLVTLSEFVAALSKNGPFASNPHRDVHSPVLEYFSGGWDVLNWLSSVVFSRFLPALR